LVSLKFSILLQGADIFSNYQSLVFFYKNRLTQGVSVVSDGWTNIKGQPLLNVLASNSRGSCFLYAEDYSGIEKTGEAITNFLLKAIEEIGPKNVIQVVTDNASNCKAAGREIQKVRSFDFNCHSSFQLFVSYFPI
jgi:hypothetical protein